MPRATPTVLAAAKVTVPVSWLPPDRFTKAPRDPNPIPFRERSSATVIPVVCSKT